MLYVRCDQVGEIMTMPIDDNQLQYMWKSGSDAWELCFSIWGALVYLRKLVKEGYIHILLVVLKIVNFTLTLVVTAFVSFVWSE